MTRNELVEALVQQRGVPRPTAERLVSTVLDSIRDALVAGDRVELRGFGTFQPRSYRAYRGRNPRNGEPVKVAPKLLPVFRLGKELREAMVEKGSTTAREKE
jgi:integration host factor subunit beta